MMSILLVVTTSKERRPDLGRMGTWTPKTRRPSSRLNRSAQQLQRPAVPPVRIVKCGGCWELIELWNVNASWTWWIERGREAARFCRIQCLAFEQVAGLVNCKLTSCSDDNPTDPSCNDIVHSNRRINANRNCVQDRITFACTLQTHTHLMKWRLGFNDSK